LYTRIPGTSAHTSGGITWIILRKIGGFFERVWAGIFPKDTDIEGKFKDYGFQEGDYVEEGQDSFIEIGMGHEEENDDNSNSSPNTSIFSKPYSPYKSKNGEQKPSHRNLNSFERRVRRVNRAALSKRRHQSSTSRESPYHETPWKDPLGTYTRGPLKWRNAVFSKDLQYYRLLQN
jgi:hypothetical protein